MRILLLATALVAACLPCHAEGVEWLDRFEGGLDGWSLPVPEHWTITDGALRLRVGGPIGSSPRRPVQFAVWKTACVGDFDLQVRIRRDDRQGEGDLLVVFGYQDALHFYYAHLSSDDGHVAVHNGLFKVDGSDRIRIGGSGSAAALPDSAWHSVRARRRIGAGIMEIYLDDEARPRFQSDDTTFGCGRVGLGSFNDTGSFDDFHLQGKPSDACRDGLEHTLPPR